jgi:hypothetical protein
MAMLVGVMAPNEKVNVGTVVRVATVHVTPFVLPSGILVTVPEPPPPPPGATEPAETPDAPTPGITCANTSLAERKSSKAYFVILMIIPF